MSSSTNAVEWVESTEEVVIIEGCLPPDSITPTGSLMFTRKTSLVFLHKFLKNCHFVLLVIPVIEAAETPIQKLLDTGDNQSGNGFCKQNNVSSSTSIHTIIGSNKAVHNRLIITL